MLFKAISTKLYFRIWLAMVLSIATVTFLFGWVNRVTHQPMPKEITIRNSEGSIIAHGFVQPNSNNVNEYSHTEDSDATSQHSSDTRLNPPTSGQYGPGSEFMLQTTDGSWLHVHLPHSGSRNIWNRKRYGWLWLMLIVGASVSLATYPVFRKLTRRLEDLKQSVALWGEGHLSTRVKVKGDDEIAYLAKQFNQSADQIQTLVNSHKSLLAYASHELKTPLTRIRMALELMGESSPQPLKEEVTRSISELDQLIDEILTASRLDAPQAELGHIELIDLTGLASEECAHTSTELDLGSVPQSYYALGNLVLLRRALRNLLDNAQKHASTSALARSDEKPIVQMSLTSVNNNPLIRIAVLDRGPGVRLDEQEKIFEPFYRSQLTQSLGGAIQDQASSTTRSSGAGLGLSLVRTICQRHGGSVHYENRPGGGSCFVILLPAQK
jgi:signal transduction histidine kinase